MIKCTHISQAHSYTITHVLTCVNIYKHSCTRMYTNKHIHKCTYMNMQAWTYIYTWMNTWTWTCGSMNVHTQIPYILHITVKICTRLYYICNYYFLPKISQSFQHFFFVMKMKVIDVAKSIFLCLACFCVLVSVSYLSCLKQFCMLLCFGNSP